MKQILLIFMAAALCGPLSIAQNPAGGLLNKAKKMVTGEGDLSNDEIGGGLKEALKLGISEAVDFLSAENGYYESIYKVLLPEEARKVTDRLKTVPGFNNVEHELVLRINRAAELAASKAKPIFVAAITQLTFKDAMNILMGEKNAATQYLHRSTYQPLYGEFRPVIISALDEVNARAYWRDAVNAYNKIPLVTRVNPELDDYVAQKALEGLFSLVEKKERSIREDVGLRTSPLLQKVFARQDR
jgi:hypothetical protein